MEHGTLHGEVLDDKPLVAVKVEEVEAEVVVKMEAGEEHNYKECHKAQFILCPKAQFILDVMNGTIDESVRKRLVRACLVLIGKANGGIRPIAIGEVVLKIAGKVLFARYASEINAHFGRLQFGCLHKKGVERVVHTHQRTFRRHPRPSFPLIVGTCIVCMAPHAV